MNKTLLILLSLIFFTACKQGDNSNTDSNDDPRIGKVAPEWSKNANIYEVNVRQYTKAGTFRAFQEHLPRLKKMGVDVVWLMPIHPIGEKNRKGSLGSYYSVRDYKAINPEFGNLDDFKALVKAVHNQGMKIIIDWVPNHTAFDNIWVDEGKLEYYALKDGELQPPFGTDWWDVAQLDFTNEALRARMLDALEFWVRETDIDGYRADVAEKVPTDYWNDVRTALDKIKPVFMLAEAEKPEHHEKAFDASYGWHLHHLMNEVAQGKKPVGEMVKDYFNKHAKEFPSHAYRMNFTSNHDENSWNGTVKERMGEASKAMAVFAATVEGLPLIYGGQEAGLDHRLKFFEKDEINWESLPLESFYTKLLALNHNNKALWNGDYGGELKILSNDKNSIAYFREKDGHKVLVFLNFSDQSKSMTVDAKESFGKYSNLFSGQSISVKEGFKAELKPYEYIVLHEE